ncbi:MAG: hypothetical protein IJS00_06395 [Paludibacteraceae bacterium]|nr:hypothetical protein [Paludibacteraceae bacterium]
MKKFILSALFLAASLVAFSQAKKPTLMVVPSDNWCNNNGFLEDYDTGGRVVRVPDYRKALQENTDLNLAISTLNNLMAERDFPLKDLEQTLKNLQQSQTEEMFTQSKSGLELAESPIDRLLRTAKADIIIYLNWDVKTTGPKKTLTYILEAKDAYTGKSVASAQGVGSPSFAAEVPVLLQEAVIANIDNFNANLQRHFEDMFANGREIALEIRVFQGNALGVDLETEFDSGTELSEIIDQWMYDNTVAHRFSKLNMTENFMSYEQVRIPLYNDNGMAMDAEMWGRQLRNVLRKAPYNLPVKLMNRGLGKVVLVLGDK